MPRLGFAVPHYDFSFPAPTGEPLSARALAYVDRAERLGFHRVWVSDHLFHEKPGQPRAATAECWTLLAAVAARTRGVRVGSLVTPVGMRDPHLLARMAATVDQVSGGRLDLGLGAGWQPEEFVEFGMDFPSAGRRIAQLEETVDTVRESLAGDAPGMLPPIQRPTPPIWVGGKGDRTLAVAARVADGWNYVWYMTPEQYENRLDALNAACADANRPFSDVRRSIGLHTLIGRDADDVERRWRRLQDWSPGKALVGVDLRDWAEPRLVGTPDEIVDQLRRWDLLGVEEVVCSFGWTFAIFDDEQLDLMAEHVLPHLD
ncbi:MAG: LLM class flavin-dependent oxidoreductase [Streptosporangiaceae bacterium]